MRYRVHILDLVLILCDWKIMLSKFQLSVCMRLGAILISAPHTGLWIIGMWHLDSNWSIQSQMGPKLFNLIPKVIIVTPKTFQRFVFCIWEIFFEWFDRFSLSCSNFVNFWARKTFFFFKQVRISPEIDWYHYKSANAAPPGIMRHQLKTDKF